MNRKKCRLRVTVLRVLNVSGWVMLTVPVLYCLFRVTVADSYIIPSESMAPTLVPGDRIWAWKLPFGARIYTSMDFSGGHPHCFRLPGLGNVKPGDILVFNNPRPAGHDDGVWFEINDVCCKRVAGCPGDRVGAVDGHCWNDRILRPIGCYEMQEILRWTFDSIFAWSGNYDVFPESGQGWVIKNWGPLIVPARGMTIDMSCPENVMYRQSVEYETGMPFELSSDKYVFKHDWFFVLGDNSPASLDSRFFGFVPDDFIIGVLASKRTRNVELKK
ncbi:MAG: S26 family signal peptidase [Bacteroidaceae bacterium]|nr:S26 family signal peptidase [Bacteroidaceae bacterium]